MHKIDFQHCPVLQTLWHNNFKFFGRADQWRDIRRARLYDLEAATTFMIRRIDVCGAWQLKQECVHIIFMCEYRIYSVFFYCRSRQHNILSAYWFAVSAASTLLINISASSTLLMNITVNSNILTVRLSPVSTGQEDKGRHLRFFCSRYEFQSKSLSARSGLPPAIPLWNVCEW